MRKFGYFIFASTVLSLLLSCESENRYAGKSIFRYNIEEGISSLDPAFARTLDNVSTINHLFNGLVQLDSELKLKPAIAKSWEISDSNRTYRFNLRSDVFYHEHEAFGSKGSRAVTASDFVYSLKRLVDPELLSPGKWVMNRVARTKEGELMIEALSDSTLEIHLKKPFPPFLGILSMQYCSVVPPEILDFYGDDFRSHPIGTGPFHFSYWKENSKLILKKNANYFERDAKGNALPYLDAIAISFTKDQEVNFLQFLKANLDYLSGLKGSYKDELLNKKGELRSNYKANYQLLTSPYLNTEYLGFNLEMPVVDGLENPLSKKEIRQAINCGFDRNKMLRFLRNGIGYSAESGFIPMGLPSFDADRVPGYEYNPSKAKQLILQAGYGPDNPLPAIVISTTPEYLDICEYLQYQLGEIGITIRIEVNPPATSNELIAQGELAFFRKSWVADYPDGENYLSLFHSKNFSPGGPNYTHFENTQFDRWYDLAMTAETDSLRWRTYQKMDSLLMSEAPIVPLFYDQVVRFVPHYISGIGINPMNLLDLKRVRKTEQSSIR